MPTIFKQLNGLLLGRLDFISIEADDIDAIEQRLISQHNNGNVLGKLNDAILVKALREHTRAIQCIYADDMLYKLVTEKHFFEDEHIPFIPINKEDLELVKCFFETFAESDLLAQFKKALDNNQLEKMLRWHYSNHIFSDKFKGEIRSLLLAKLNEIEGVIEEYYYSSEPIAVVDSINNKLFYQLLNRNAHIEIEAKLSSILRLCLTFTEKLKGVGLTARLIVGLSSYPFTDVKNKELSETAYKHLGSDFGYNLKIFIAVILLISVALIGYNKYAPGDEFKMPDDPAKAQEITNLLNKHRNIKEDYIKNWTKSRCATLDDNGYWLAKYGQISKIESSVGKIPNGTSLINNTAINPAIPATLEVFTFVNNVAKPVVLLVYFKSRNEGKSLKLVPTSYPFGWNMVYVAPNDSIKISTMIDYFSIKIGGELKVINFKNNKQNDIEKYHWCDETESDIELYKHTFFVSNVQKMQNARVVLKNSTVGYKVMWIGPAHTIFDNMLDYTLHENDSLFIKAKKGIKYEASFN